jgi:O-antigen/teichoic acid export membrane protein
VTSKVIKAGKIVLIGSFISRGISALSSIILARLLFENDYGALVIATIFTGLIGQIGGMGYEIYYLQYKGSEEEKAKVLDQVFNLRLVTNAIMFFIQLLIGLGLLLLTDDKMSGGIILIMSFSLLLEGFNAPNEVLLKSRMDFKKITIGNILKEFSSTVGKVGGALLGIGGYCFGIGPVLGSLTRMVYLLKVQKYRPERFNWNGPVIKKIFDFGKYVLFGSTAMYAVQQVDRILLSLFFPKNIVGQYGFAWGVGAAPFTYLVSPQQQLIMTYTTRYKSGDTTLFKKLIIVQRIISLLILPVMIVLVVYTNEFISLIYSDRWLHVAEIVKLLLIYYTFLSLLFPFTSLLTGLGYPHVTSKITLIKAGFLIVVLLGVVNIFKGELIAYIIAFCSISLIFDVIKVVLGIKKTALPLTEYLSNEKYEIILILLIAVFGFTSVTIHYEAIRGLAVLCYLLIYFFSFFVLDRQKSKTAIKVLFKKNENSTTSS